MCTLGAKQINSGWFLIKTRDPVSWMRWDDEIKLFSGKSDRFRKYIIQNPDPHEDGYYGGINEKGVAFVSTYVHVDENQISYIRRPYIRLILDASSAKEAVKIIKSFNPRIGGNMFVADGKECFAIEGAPEKYFVEKISLPSVKTNHYVKLPNKNLVFNIKPELKTWSEFRKERAEELINESKTINDLKSILKDRKNSNRGISICRTKRELDCFTHSAFIFDTKNKLAYYCQGNPMEKPFRKYSFS